MKVFKNQVKKKVAFLAFLYIWSNAQIFICFQPVVVIPLVRAVCSVLIQVDNVPAMLDIKAQNVMLLVVVIPLVQTVQHVMLLQVNVLARMVLLVPLVPLLQVRFCQ